ncbi:hypothetical protein M2159_005272 [Streptomyces sp. SAI-090]|nr:hypothetical protein [Streptomyces sp. SAI-090]
MSRACTLGPWNTGLPLMRLVVGADPGAGPGVVGGGSEGGGSGGGGAEGGGAEGGGAEASGTGAESGGGDAEADGTAPESEGGDAQADGTTPESGDADTGSTDGKAEGAAAGAEASGTTLEAGDADAGSPGGQAEGAGAAAGDAGAGPGDANAETPGTTPRSEDGNPQADTDGTTTPEPGETDADTGSPDGQAEGAGAAAGDAGAGPGDPGGKAEHALPHPRDGPPDADGTEAGHGGVGTDADADAVADGPETDVGCHGADADAAADGPDAGVGGHGPDTGGPAPDRCDAVDADDAGTPDDVVDPPSAAPRAVAGVGPAPGPECSHALNASRVAGSRAVNSTNCEASCSQTALSTGNPCPAPGVQSRPTAGCTRAATSITRASSRQAGAPVSAPHATRADSNASDPSEEKAHTYATPSGPPKSLPTRRRCEPIRLFIGQL